jgi:tRNA1Val (adenine37-N6)-methyltransferase
MDEPITLDKLIGTWTVHQLERGHRFSTDDLVTAWRAARAAPGARRLLDLGCGIGSVGLSTLYQFPPDATLVGVEAQEVSVGLLRRTLAENGLTDRVRVVLGDLRDPEVLPAGSTFELVTGSPPYVPVGRGLQSAHPQRAHARIELRGSVFDYCAAARRYMAPGARFAFVMAAQDPRTEAAPLAHDLVVVERWDYVFARRREPHIATLVCARREDVSDVPRVTGRLVIRGPDGEWTDEYQAFRKEMGVTDGPKTPNRTLPPGA